VYVHTVIGVRIIAERTVYTQVRNVYVCKKLHMFYTIALKNYVRT